MPFKVDLTVFSEKNYEKIMKISKNLYIWSLKKIIVVFGKYTSKHFFFTKKVDHCNIELDQGPDSNMCSVKILSKLNNNCLYNDQMIQIPGFKHEKHKK